MHPAIQGHSTNPPTMRTNQRQVVETNATVKEMHDASEKFDPKTENVFKYLQVMSACAVSFRWVV